MQSIGERLKQARLKKGLSLEQVYKETKIHRRVLEALEQDRAHNFLSHIYIKGFLKSYARYLGLDSEGLLKEYVDSQKPQPPEPPELKIKVNKDKEQEVVLEKRPKGISRLKPLLISRIALIIVLSFAFILYFRFAFRRISRQSSISQGGQVKIKVSPVEKPKEELEKKPSVEVTSAPSRFSIGQANGPALTAEKTQELILEVKTLDACWMRVRADDKAVFEKTLPKGKRQRWQARERIELRIGKPEALEVFLNGEPIDLKKTRVKKSLIITQEGVKGR